MIKMPKFSPGLQNEADKKSLCDLYEIVDDLIRADDDQKEDRFDSGFMLAQLSIQKNKPVFYFYINEGVGPTQFFMVGTYVECLQKLKRLPDDWV